MMTPALGLIEHDFEDEDDDLGEDRQTADFEIATTQILDPLAARVFWYTTARGIAHERHWVAPEEEG